MSRRPCSFLLKRTNSVDLSVPSRYYVLRLDGYDPAAVKRDIQRFLGANRTHFAETSCGLLVGVKLEYAPNFEFFLTSAEDPVSFREVNENRAVALLSEYYP